MSNHLENPQFAGTPTRGSSAYPSELIPQNFPWRAAPGPYPVGFPATANPDYVYEQQFVAPGGAPYRARATPLYPWRVNSDVLKQVIRNLALQVDSEVMEVRKETCGPNRSRVTIVLETPD
ncbi:hypothetical protein EI94DRAFT_1808594 [Lactarius quietus]|nr:hypothetical protein EI94DRAFT_1808594 [Lactarius quietus]